MNNYEKTDLRHALSECQSSAMRGYGITYSEVNRLENVLIDARDEVQKAITSLSNSKCKLPEVNSALTNQLTEIQDSFDAVYTTVVKDMNALRSNLSRFSITLFGQTNTGKSTLMEILINGDGKSIGKGQQRTTRDVRKYSWNELDITDVPGIAAYDGIEDEKIAFEAAKSADLILFLISDNAPSAEEAEWFGKIMSLGKPIIGILNVKATIPDSGSMKLAIRDVQKKMDFERLNRIKAQFFEYSTKLGQSWSRVPFVYVHLQAAYISKHIDDEVISKKLYEISRFKNLEMMIINQVITSGKLYRIKTFIDVVTNPMIDSVDELLSQSDNNSSQGRAIVSKIKQLNSWKTRFYRDGRSSIDTFVNATKNDLYSEMAVFAEEHFDDSDAGEQWNELIKEKHITQRSDDVMKDIEQTCIDKLNETARSISVELKFNVKFSADKQIKMHKIIDFKRALSWGTTIGSGSFTIAAIIAKVVGSTIAGPLGWVAAGIGVAGMVASSLLKNRGVKQDAAIRELEMKLKKNIDINCQRMNQDMVSFLDAVMKNRLNMTVNELNNVNSVVFNLADIQKQLAWKLNDYLLNLNQRMIVEALKFVTTKEDVPVTRVARLPGKTVLILLRDGERFPDDVKKELSTLMNESINFVFFAEDKRILISRILGKSVDRSKISVEEKIGMAHILVDDIPPEMVNRIKLAQQMSTLLIVK